jgi:hypothetical protein
MYPPLHVAFVSLHSLNVTSILLIVIDVVITFIFKCFKKIVLLLVLEGIFYVLPSVLNIHTTNPIDKLDICHCSSSTCSKFGVIFSFFS